MKELLTFTIITILIAIGFYFYKMFTPTKYPQVETNLAPIYEPQYSNEGKG